MHGRTRWWWLLAPALLSGCSGLPGWSTESPAAAAGTPAAGPTWLLVDQGRATPSVGPRSGASPNPSPTLGYLPLPTPTPSSSAADPSCAAPGYRPGQINGLTVSPGPGTATVSWPDIGGADLLTYRVTATAQRLVNGTQRDVGWRSVAPSGSCARLSTTITGLERSAPYTFTLEAVFTRKGMDGLRDETVARSQVVSTS